MIKFHKNIPSRKTAESKQVSSIWKDCWLLSSFIPNSFFLSFMTYNFPHFFYIKTLIHDIYFNLCNLFYPHVIYKTFHSFSFLLTCILTHRDTAWVGREKEKAKSQDIKNDKEIIRWRRKGKEEMKKYEVENSWQM